MLILGVDPGLASTGWGAVSFEANRLRYCGHGTIKTEAGLESPIRLLQIHENLNSVIQEFRPELCGVEKLFFARNVKTALPVAEARGVVLFSCAKGGVRVREFTPMQIKQAVVGTGQADKKQVESMVKMLLGMPSLKGSDHAMDALAAAICTAHTGGVW